MVRALEVLCPTVQTLTLTVVKTQQSDLCGGTFLSVAPEPATWGGGGGRGRPGPSPPVPNDELRILFFVLMERHTFFEILSNEFVVHLSKHVSSNV